jgi:hypothetical protein
LNSLRYVVEKVDRYQCGGVEGRLVYVKAALEPLRGYGCQVLGSNDSIPAFHLTLQWTADLIIPAADLETLVHRLSVSASNQLTVLAPYKSEEDPRDPFLGL